MGQRRSKSRIRPIRIGMVGKLPKSYQSPPITLVQSGENADATIEFLVAHYQPHVEGALKPNEFWNVRTACMDFLLKLYPDTFPVDSFTPKCLKLVRTSMVQSRRFCRKVINGYIKRIVAVFQWGTGEDIVSGSTLHALKAVKALRKTERRRCYTTRRHK